jgi:hypothetical protein
VIDSEVFEIQPQAQSIRAESMSSPVPVTNNARPHKKLRPRQIVVERDDASHELVNKLLEKTDQLTERAHQSELTAARAEADAKLDVMRAEMRAEQEKINARLEQIASEKGEKPDPAANFTSKIFDLLTDRAKDGDDEARRQAVKVALGESLEEKDTSWSGIFGDLLGKAIDNPTNALNLVGGAWQVVGAMRGKQPPVAQQPQPQPTQQPQAAPTSQPEATASRRRPARRDEQPLPFEQAFSNVTINMLADIEAGTTVRRSARAFVELMRVYPEQAAMVEQNLALPSAFNLQVLAQQIPQAATLLNKPESLTWLDGLKAEIQRRRAPEVAEVAQSDGAHVAATE